MIVHPEFVELQRVVLVKNIPVNRLFDGYLESSRQLYLTRGSEGTIVNISKDGIGEVYDVEFVDNKGHTSALVTLKPEEITPCLDKTFAWFIFQANYGPNHKYYAEDYKAFKEPFDSDDVSYEWSKWVETFADNHISLGYSRAIGGYSRVHSLPEHIKKVKLDTLEDKIDECREILSFLDYTPKYDVCAYQTD